MSDKHCVLAIDQGTSSSRAIVFDRQARQISLAQQEFTQLFPRAGWVEHQPEAIFESVLDVARDAIAKAQQQGYKVVALGISNQRETTVLWDKSSGQPLANAIVWQDRRTADVCQQLREQGCEAEIQQRSGLLLDPYFSASKIAWLLDNVEGARARAERGELAFGTIDSYLIWRLSGGQAHVTDATNASRTSLYNIHTGQWDAELLRLFRVPESVLPTVLDSSANFGLCREEFFGAELPLLGVAGDQQAAAIGQCCFNPGDVKSTYGTGCFVLMNSGAQALQSHNRLLTTVAYQLNGRPTYALEGSMFVAGAAVQWLRDGLGLIASSGECEALARQARADHGVCFIPALTGLAAPYWRADMKGSLHGLDRNSGKAEMIRAVLESIAYLSADLFTAMAANGVKPELIKVDGGMAANSWLMQYLADILDLSVYRPQQLETTALGAAYLAGRQLDFYGDFNEFGQLWQADEIFKAGMSNDQRSQAMAAWQRTMTLALSA